MNWWRFAFGMIGGLLALCLVVLGINILRESVASLSTGGGLVGTIMIVLGVGTVLSIGRWMGGPMPTIRIQLPRIRR